MQWMIYGANGFTGQLIAKESVRRGHTPLLAGRNEREIGRLGTALGLQTRSFGLSSHSEIVSGIADVAVVLHCAGPFSKTSEPMLSACLRRGIHYLDITGEISVFERCFARRQEAVVAGSVVIPGVGFDVVPTDCLAMTLKQQLPDAIRLEIGVCSSGSPSKGTAKTMVEGFARGGAVRRDGAIATVPLGWHLKEIAFRDGLRVGATAPVGEVSALFHSTGIPDIEVYMAMSPVVVSALRLLRHLRPIVGLPPVQHVLQAIFEKLLPNPDAERLAQAHRASFWCRVENKEGHYREGTLLTASGYPLTVRTAIAAIERLEARPLASGCYTPAMAFGADFITTIADCDLELRS